MISAGRIVGALAVVVAIACVARWIQLDRAVDATGRPLREYVGGWAIGPDPGGPQPKGRGGLQHQIWIDERAGKLFAAGVSVKFRPCMTAEPFDGGMRFIFGSPVDYFVNPKDRVQIGWEQSLVSVDGDSLVLKPVLAPYRDVGRRMQSEVDPGKMFGIEGKGLRVYSCEPTLWQQVKLFFALT